jgi:hypothetical protein
LPVSIPISGGWGHCFFSMKNSPFLEIDELFYHLRR